MSNETKRDVFGKMKWELIRNLANTIDQNGGLRPLEDATKVGTNYAKRYAAALPDDLPVIPKAVGEYIQERKAAHESLAFALTARLVPKEVIDWMCVVAGDSDTELSQIEYVKQQDIFARAWVIGVWHVEETGEIVKLEAEK